MITWATEHNYWINRGNAWTSQGLLRFQASHSKRVIVRMDAVLKLANERTGFSLKFLVTENFIDDEKYIEADAILERSKNVETLPSS